MTKDEITKNIANRFVHSQTYIVLYLAMAALSITTVVLSLVNDCPTLPFYILEFIINAAMIIEVGIRFVAFGRVSTLLPLHIFPRPTPLSSHSNSGNPCGISWTWS